jgi:HEAT repeat protein
MALRWLSRRARWLALCASIVPAAVRCAAVGPFRSTGDVPGTPEFHALVDGLARHEAVDTESADEGGEPSQVHQAFQRVVAAASREQVLALVLHRSPIVRGYMAELVPERFANDTRALLPVLADTTTVRIVTGCIVSEVRVADLAIDALCRHATGPTAPDTLLEVVERRGDSRVRGRAIECAAPRRPARARSMALRLVTSDDAPLVAGAARALGTVGGRDACATLAPLAANASDAVREAAAAAIGALSCPEALDVLGRLLGDSAPAVTVAAASGYLRQPRHDRDALVKILAGPRAHQTARALAAQGTPEALRLVDEYMVANPSDDAPVQAVLEGPRNEAATWFMRRRLQTSTNSFVRTRAIAYLADVKDAESREQYERSLGAQDVSEPIAAAAAVAAIRDLDAVPTLEELLDRRNPNVRLAAARALVTLGAKQSVAALERAARNDTSWAGKEMNGLAKRLGGP